VPNSLTAEKLPQKNPGKDAFAREFMGSGFGYKRSDPRRGCRDHWFDSPHPSRTTGAVRPRENLYPGAIGTTAVTDQSSPAMRAADPTPSRRCWRGTSSEVAQSRLCSGKAPVENFAAARRSPRQARGKRINLFSSHSLGVGGLQRQLHAVLAAVFNHNQSPPGSGHSDIGNPAFLIMPCF
jgi:hypothetical protein